MTSRRPSGEGVPVDAPGTLGDLLYADRTKLRAPEGEWIDLVRAIAAGDQAALRALYDRSHRLVFTLILRMTGSSETAQELTVDVFHDVWRRASAFDAEGGSVVGWIMNQARSRAIDRIRFESRKKRTRPHAQTDSDGAENRAPDEIADVAHQRRHLEKALASLTPEERQALETTYFSDLTYAEAAARLDQPLGTIKTRIRSALQKLRLKLDLQGEDS